MKKRVFCIAGPIDPERHYFIPHRLDWVELRRMDSSHADEGHLILFDRKPHKSWEEKIFHLSETFNSKIIQVWGA